MIALLGLLIVGSIATYHINDWKYIGHHECKRVGYLEPEKSTVYPAIIDSDKPYILFKQKNKDDSYITGCIKDPKALNND